MNQQESNEPLSHGEPDAVTRLLNELPEVDPPSTLTGAVMSRIGRDSQTHARGWWPATITGEDRSWRKKCFGVSRLRRP